MALHSCARPAVVRRQCRGRAFQPRASYASRSAAAQRFGRKISAPPVALPPAVESPAPTPEPPAESAARPLPETYRRLVASRCGDSFASVATLQSLPLPKPAAGEVLVRVTHAGVNGGCETFRARGEHWFERNRSLESFPLGAEGCGVVVAHGPDVSEPPLGAPVSFVGGAFSEFVISRPASLWPVSAASPGAAACAISGTTAAAALLGTACLEPGETLLVTAAGGATGSFAVQLGVRAGARVVAVCGGSAKAELVRGLGAFRVVDHTTENVAQVLADEFPNAIDVAYEGVGGDMLSAALSQLAPNGRCLIVGYISGALLRYPHNAQLASQQTESAARMNSLAESLFWSGGALEVGEGRKLFGSVWPGRPAVLAAKRELHHAVDAGRVKPIVDATPFIGLESVVPAVEFMLSGKALGKVVVSL